MSNSEQRPNIHQHGRYRIYYWHKLSDTGHDGWIVQVWDPQGFGTIMSKHVTLEYARAAAAKYHDDDVARGIVPPTK